MNVDLEIQLIEAMDALDQGEALDKILARHPESAAALRPMLITATALPTFRMMPSEAQKMKSRQAFLQQGAALRQAAQHRRPAVGFMSRLATMVAALSIAFAVMGGGAVAASGSALPGDPLYGLKRTVENVRLTFTGSASARATLEAEFDRQRRTEANALLNAGREAEVRFSGPIESIQPDAWIIGGLAVRVDANTQIDGQPAIDRLADVHGQTGRNGLRAIAIMLAQPADATPAPSPVPTEKPAPLATTTPATVTPTPTSDPTSTPEPTQPEPTKPRPTRVPPTATVVPTPEPVSIEFTGSVNSQTAANWVIDGTTVEIDSRTIVNGNIGMGQRVDVQALRYADGRLLATQIELINDSGGGGSGDAGQNSNGNDQNGNTNHNDNHNSNSDDNRNDNENNNHNSNDNHNDNENSNHNSNDH